MRSWNGTYDLLPLEPDDPPEPVRDERPRCLACGEAVPPRRRCLVCREPVCLDCRGGHLEEDHPDELAEIASGGEPWEAA